MRSLLTLLIVLALAAPALAADGPTTRPHAPLERIRVSDDKTHFVRGERAARVVMWGFNYDHDDAGRLIWLLALAWTLGFGMLMVWSAAPRRTPVRPLGGPDGNR